MLVVTWTCSSGLIKIQLAQILGYFQSNCVILHMYQFYKDQVVSSLVVDRLRMVPMLSLPKST